MATDPQHPPSRRAGGRAGGRPQGRDSAERRTASCSGGWPPADWGGWTPSPPLPPRPPPPCPRPRPQISAGAAGLRGASGTDLGSDVAFEERRRGSIINPHFLLQTADATLTAFSAKPAAGKAVRTRPRTGLSGPKGLRALEQRARAYATHTFPARPNQAQQPQRQDQAGPEELQEPRESSGESLTQTRASTSP